MFIVVNISPLQNVRFLAKQEALALLGFVYGLNLDYADFVGFSSSFFQAHWILHDAHSPSTTHLLCPVGKGLTSTLTSPRRVAITHVHFYFDCRAGDGGSIMLEQVEGKKTAQRSWYRRVRPSSHYGSRIILNHNGLQTQTWLNWEVPHTSLIPLSLLMAIHHGSREGSRQEGGACGSWSSSETGEDDGRVNSVPLIAARG